MEIAAVHALAELARQEQSDIVAAAYGGIEDLTLRSGIPDPEAVRSAADRQDRAGGGQGRDGFRRGDAGRSPISRPTPSGSSISSTTAAR